MRLREPLRFSSSLLPALVKTSLLFHSIERLLQQLEIARLAEFFSRAIDLLLLQRID